jgi:transcription antitermination factor NusG
LWFIEGINAVGTTAEQRKYWTVVATKSQSGREAIRNIVAQLFDYYQPEYRTPPVRGVRKTVPLFPGYLFVRVSRANWKPLASTRDVKHVFQCGPHPARISNDEIATLRSAENALGYTEPAFASPPAFEAGESVQATRGIFRDHYGKFIGLADTRGGHRVRVLFDMLGRSAEYEISAFDLGRVAA